MSETLLLLFKKERCQWFALGSSESKNMPKSKLLLLLFALSLFFKESDGSNSRSLQKSDHEQIALVALF